MVLETPISKQLPIKPQGMLSLVKLAEMQKALGAAYRHGHSQPLDKASGDFDLF